MGDVVSLDSRRPHVAGEYVCLQCKHEWAGVVLAPNVAIEGVDQFVECPSCGACRGTHKWPFGPGEGQSFFRCNCGCSLLTAVMEKRVALLCVNCGADHIGNI